MARLDIDPRDRLIFALDVSSRADAAQWIERLGDAVTFYKIGLELLASGDYFAVLDDLLARGKRVFADLKLHDVPATVAATVKGLARRRIDFVTVHAQHPAMLRAANHVKGDLRLLGVTVLTSIDRAELDAESDARDPADVVVARARMARDCGCDGVIASGQEAASIRRATADDFAIVCPGIRPAAAGDDQRRIVDVPTAFANGADHIVVGRPIRQATDPRAAAQAIQAQIAAAIFQ